MENNLCREAAIEYLTKNKWSVIPSNGKIPIASWKEFQVRYANEETVRLWFEQNPTANVGIVTGKISNLTVIDIDGEKGNDSLKKLNLPITKMVKTPHGFHFYFKYNSTYPQGVGILPGIDIRNDGGFVVAPPSINGGGTCYEWVDDNELADLLDFEKIFRGYKKPEVIQLKDPDWVAKYLKEGVKEKDPGRNAIAARMIGHYRTKNLGAEETFEIMKVYAERCTPPMDLTELWTTIGSIYKYAGDIHNAKINEKPDLEKRGSQYVFSWQQYGLVINLDQLIYERDGLHCEIDVEFEYPGERVFKYGPARLNLSSTLSVSKLCDHLYKRFAFDWITAMDMVTRMAILHEREGEQFENLADLDGAIAPPWILKPFVIEGETTILFGDGGIGKSALAMAVLLTIQTGKSILGIPRKLLKGLYLDWESSSFTHAQRFFAFKKKYSIDDSSISYLRCIAPLPELRNQLTKRIIEEKIGFLVIDSAGSACGGEPEKAESAIKLFNAVNGFKTTNLILAHVTKSNDSSQKPFGSTFFHNLARSTIEVKNKQEAGEDSTHLILMHRKTNYGRLERPFGLHVKFVEKIPDVLDTIEYRFEDPTTIEELAKELRPSDQIFAVLRNGGKTVNEIVEMTGLKRATVRSTLGRREGQLFCSKGAVASAVAKSEEKTWFLINKGFLAVASADAQGAVASADAVLLQNEILPEDVI